MELKSENTENLLVDENDDDQYYLISSDNVEFPITKKEMKLSNLVMVATNESEDVKIPILSVKSLTLEHIIKYLKYHSIFPIPENNISNHLKSNIFSEEVKCEWDIHFIEKDVMGDPNTAKSNIYDLINAANYMDIEPLLKLSLTKVASMIKGESIDKIKKIISTDYPYDDNHKN